MDSRAAENADVAAMPHGVQRAASNQAIERPRLVLGDTMWKPPWSGVDSVNLAQHRLETRRAPVRRIPQSRVAVGKREASGWPADLHTLESGVDASARADSAQVAAEHLKVRPRALDRFRHRACPAATSSTRP